MNDPEQVLECNYELVRNEFPHWNLEPSSMELADGSCTADEIRAFLGPDYSGTLDLRMCRSKFLGEGLKRTAPRIRVLMNQWPVTPGVQALFYKYTIQVLSAGGDDFPGASNSLHESFSRRFA
jgi:hypothetical protein